MSRQPRTPSNRCLPVAEWTPLDQAAWTQALSDPSGVAAHWSTATRRMVIGGYGRWLTWAGARNLLDAPTSPAARVTAASLSAYIADLQAAVVAFTVAARVEQVGNAMRAMAPAQNWRWVLRRAEQIRAQAKASRQRAERPEQDPSEEPAPVSSPTMMSNRCLPLAAWPELDRAAWEAAQQPGDVLDPGLVATGWAATTQDLVVNGYGRWLTWLVEHQALDPALPPSARVTPQRLLAYATDLKATNGSFTVAARIEQVGNAMRAMAPHQDWRWIQRAADRLRSQAVSVRDKRGRLRSPDELVALGMALMTQAEDFASGPPIRRAGHYRDGLLIALLALRPMRARNLAAILCGQHLVRRGTAWSLMFAANETKTQRALVGGTNVRFDLRAVGGQAVPRNPRGIGPSPVSADDVALTPRETQALGPVCGGRSAKEVARAMDISPRTAERHLANVRTKLGIHGSRVSLVRYALANGLVS